MKNKIVKTLSLLLVLITAISAVSIPAFALEWDGNSAEGGSNTVYAGPNGYAIATDTWANCVAYRFSLVDKYGVNKVSKVIDIFRDSHMGRHGYSTYKFNNKCNKKQLIGLQNSGFGTSNNKTNCYKEVNYSFATKLPDPSGMSEWQNNTTNLNMVLNLLGAGNISTLKNGDMILVEPVFDVRLESVYHALTVTEMALYGKHILGSESNGGSSSTSESWGFISIYANKHYPNSLFTPDGQGLWDGVSSSTKRIKFKNIINKGYGVGIAYTETKNDYSSDSLSLTAIEPNAAYREETEVISSYRIWNSSQKDFIPSYGLKVRLRIYKDGATSPFKTITKNVVVPASSYNLVYFKWKVPTNLGGKNVTLKADIYCDGSYWNEISNQRATTPYSMYTTPDTQYEENAPSGFSVPSKPSGSTGAASWWIYEYENGGFVKKTYKVTLSKSTPNKIEPATGETAFKTDGVWTMKSGYGISLQSRILINPVYGTNTASSSSSTLPQYAYALFPEYSYVFADGKATTLNKVAGEAYSYFEFPTLSTYGKVHFTPLWYPDGDYTVKIVQSDCWTPAGMISLGIVPGSITISGNAYDDWYAGRR